VKNKVIAAPTLEHHPIDLQTYESLYGQCVQSNILQSAVYGEAKRLVEGFDVKRMVIRESGKPVALYQVLTKRVPLLGKVARINRGPLCIGNGSLPAEALKRLFKSFYEEWIVGQRSFLQMAPNIQDGLLNSEDFEGAGFIPSVEPHWQSGWLSLDQPKDNLRKALQQKWRNLLNKAEKMGTELHPVGNEVDMDFLLSEYDRFMKDRDFQSTSSSLIKAMYRSSHDSIFAVIARKQDRYLGAVVIVKHGDAATYLVGITSDEGRKANANYLLLWNGLIHCMEAGLRWFDIGGIDEVNTPGIAHFKKGLGYTPYQLVGEFEGYKGLRHGLLSRLKSYYYSRGRRKKG
jgi:lipid II:glycine glycyltransferase (peptidoglycan interpeptide bridge formation enzyme)